ncbi:translation initiation factor IF-3 [bacterium]|nr:translation initiation factor IF-3 [bacterium]
MLRKPKVFEKREKAEPSLKVNEKINAPEVRVIGPDGSQVGVIEIVKALKLAEEYELDLVEISPTANPPVCKILDSGKYFYELQKKEKENRKKQHNVSVREVRFEPYIAGHDLETKIKKSQEFLENGDKVKFTVMFHGRQLAYKDNGVELLNSVVEMLGGKNELKFDKEIGMEGNNRMTMIVQKNK